MEFIIIEVRIGKSDHILGRFYRLWGWCVCLTQIESLTLMTIIFFRIFTTACFLHLVELRNKDFGPFLDEGFKVAGETSPGGSKVKNPPANERDTGDVSSIVGWGRSPGVGNGIPLQYSCLGNPLATVHGVAKGQTPLSMPTHTALTERSQQDQDCAENGVQVTTGRFTSKVFSEGSANQDSAAQGPQLSFPQREID